MTQTTITDWTTGDTATHNGIVVTLGLFPASSGYRHNCGDPACRRFDITPADDQRCPAFAWECELSPVADQPSEPSDAFPHVGAELAWTSPDRRITITVRRAHFTWTVETYQGTLRVTDNCGAYGSEGEARAVARGYATMYRAEHSTPAPTSGSPVVNPTPDSGQTEMTGPEARVINEALRYGGRIWRYKRQAVAAGHGDNYADVSMLQAMARRGFVTLAGTRYRPLHADVTNWGATRAAEETTTSAD
jgi:hypothetical protein